MPTDFKEKTLRSRTDAWQRDATEWSSGSRKRIGQPQLPYSHLD